MKLHARRFNLALTLERQLPIFALLNPRGQAVASWVALAVGLAAGWAGYFLLEWPLWSITGVVLLALLPVGVLKWRDDLRLFGPTAMLLSIILIAQGAHTIEHITQWAQYYLLYLPARQSNGLLSAANAEWVHFVWNWGVLLIVGILMIGGMRNRWAWFLLLIATAHTLEHTYLFLRYQQVLNELAGLDVFTITAQGLPGILGRDGWLARSEVTQGTFLCTLPGLTTANRLDVHFWWNVIEMGLLLIAGSVYMRAHPRLTAAIGTR